tara:strand:+ start:3466 stop:4629 length:1164 start_codon:yes stop_codon:yes gene_type:complete
MNSFSNINYPVESFLDKLKNGNNNENKIKQQKGSSGKKQIKVLIPLEPPYTFISKSDGKVDGYTYDMWLIIKKKLEKKNYSFKNIIVRTTDFNKLIDKMAEGKYDIAPFPFFPSAKREKKVNFSLPVLFEKVVIVHNPVLMANTTNIILNYLLKTVLPSMLIIVILGLLLGNLLYFFDKKRGYRRSLMTSIASLFGESGFLSERWGGRDGFLAEKYHRFSGIPMIILIFVISYFFSMGMQAYTTAQAVSLSNINKFTYDDIAGKTFVLPEGYSAAMGDSMKRLGGKIIRGKGKIIDLYADIQKGKYDGLIIGLQRAKYDIKENNIKGLMISNNLDLSMQTGNFAVTRQDIILLEDVNRAILEAKETKEAQEACKVHQSPKNAFLCAL